MPKPRLDPATRDQLTRLLNQAKAGEFPAFARLLAAAGYCHGHYVRSVGAAAAHFGISETIFKVWKSKPGFPMRTNRGWDLSAIAQWNQKRVENQTSEQRPPEDTREYWATRNEKHKYEQATSQVVRAEDHERGLMDRSSWIVGVLKQLPGELAPRVAGKTVQQARKIIKAVCEKHQRRAFGTRKE